MKVMRMLRATDQNSVLLHDDGDDDHKYDAAPAAIVGGSSVDSLIPKRQTSV